MAMKLSVEPLGHVHRQLPVGTFGPMLGWKTGLLKELHVARNAHDEPRLHHISIMHAKVGRLVGTALEANLRAAGSGLTVTDAFCRAAGEVLERYACCWYDTEELVLDSYAGMRKRGLNAVPPQDFGLFSAEQYQQPGFRFVPFTEDTPVAWVEGRSLVHRCPAYLPAQLVYFGYECLPGERAIGYGTSSGCACAPTMIEALVKGICEQVERDAVMITWFSRRRPPAVDLDRFSDVKHDYEAVRLFSATRRFEVRDITTDIPIPSFMGIARLDVAGAERLFVGGAASLDPSEGVRKALLEVGQGVPFIKTILIHNPDQKDMRFDNFDDNLRFYADERNGHHLRFLFESPDYSEAAAVPVDPDPRYRLRTLVENLARVGIDVIAIDHTTPDVASLGLAVGRAYCPGLVQLGVPALPFLGGRRLWDVPRALGMELVELNKMPHPYP